MIRVGSLVGGILVVMVLLAVAIGSAAGEPSPRPRPSVWMGPPGRESGQAVRELFEHPEAWPETRSQIDVLFFADLNLNRFFSDDELRRWFDLLGEWKLKFALEVGAIKHWAPTGERCFAAERPLWERFTRLGARLHAVAMDEPLCCARKELDESDENAVRETASYIALVRQNYPQVLIGDIEPYPFLPLADHERWIEALERELAARHVRGLDFYRLDVNWLEFSVAQRGSWQEVKKLEQFCRRRKLPFQLIYWPADFPAAVNRGLGDDSTWYISTLQQAYDYALVGGSPDALVIQSWVDGPRRTLGETEEFTFTRAVRDLARKFAPRQVDEKGTANSVRFVRATVDLYVDRDHKLIAPESFTVDKQQDIARLANFFPGVGTDWQSEIAGAWERQVRVIFVKPDGARVEVISDFDSWSEGHGDRRTAPGLEAHVRAAMDAARKP